MERCIWNVLSDTCSGAVCNGLLFSCHMASVLLSAFTVYMSVIPFLIFDRQEYFSQLGQIHISIDEMEDATSEEVIHGASTDVHCRWGDTRPCYTTRRRTASDGKVILFRLSRSAVFTLSLDVSLWLLTTIIAGGAKEFNTLDSTLEGYIVR